MHPSVQLDSAAIAAFCERNGIRRLSIFGSALGDSFRPDSDLDLLVAFEPDSVPGLLALIGMEEELSELTGFKVDLRTPAELSRYFRDEVMQNAVVQYAGQHGSENRRSCACESAP